MKHFKLCMRCEGAGASCGAEGTADSGDSFSPLSSSSSAGSVENMI
jgi:hypothetical protein